LQDQVHAVRGGPLTTPGGRTRNIPTAVPIDAYLVAESTASLQNHLKLVGWTPSPDHQSHVCLDIRNNVVYRHVTWTTLLECAAQRHREFFERLNLPPPY